MVDWSNVGNGLAGAFVFLIVAPGLLLWSMTAGIHGNLQWHQLMFLQIIRILSVNGFVAAMAMAGFAAGFIAQEFSPSL